MFPEEFSFRGFVSLRVCLHHDTKRLVFPLVFPNEMELNRNEDKCLCNMPVDNTNDFIITATT